MRLLVKKFGGTSVANIDRICAAADIIERYAQEGDAIIAVVSAMSGVTNSLISKCAAMSDLADDASLREYDAALSSGETLTAALLALKLQNKGLKAISLCGWQVPVFTTSQHRVAKVTKIDAEFIQGLVKNGIIPVITGFQGINPNKDITTLGKGGSDTTASLVAAALKADKCYIYTDVDGIYSADPRVVTNAKKLNYISQKQMLALSSRGAKVLQVRSAIAADRYNLNMEILSSFDPELAGTNIIKENEMEEAIVKAVTANRDILIVNCQLNSPDGYIRMLGFLAKNDFSYFDSNYMSQYCTANFTIDIVEHGRLRQSLDILVKDNIIKDYEFVLNLAEVSVIGSSLKNSPQTLNSALNLLQEGKIEVFNVDVQDHHIAFRVNDQQTDNATKILHKIIEA